MRRAAFERHRSDIHLEPGGITVISSNRWLVLLLVAACGCSGITSPGSEAAARQHFAKEFEKWMAGQESEVSTMRFRTEKLLTPISYDIRSVLADEPDPLATESKGDLNSDWKSWPAFRFNITIEWKSHASTPLNKVTTYTLTWNPHEKRWYVAERFL